MSTPAKRPFRFGVQLYRAESVQAWQNLARKAEALGYDVLLFPDHFGATFAWSPALAVAATATTSLRFGTFVLQNPLRHPALTAMEAATVDLLSGGRFELGLGAGGSLMSDFEQTGIPFDPPKDRAGALEESVRVLKDLLTGEPTTFHGHYYQLNDFQSYPKPVQEHLPLLIGAGGPRLLRLAAREADIVSILPLMRAQGGDFHLEESTAAAFRHKIDLLRETAGERFDRLEINMLLQRVIVTDQANDVAKEMAEPWSLPFDEVLRSPLVLIGTVDEMVEKIERQRAEFGLSYYVVHDRYLDEFVPVLERLKGK